VRVCYFGTYNPAFARNGLLLAGLRSAGLDVIECRVPLWRDTADKLAAARGGPALAGRLAGAWRALARRYRALGPHDAVIVGYAGQFDVLLAHRLVRCAGRALLLDAFLSLAETVEDRGLARPGSRRWHAARLLDRLAAGRADRVLVDTRCHAAYFARQLGVPSARLAVVPMGAWPRPPAPLPNGPTFEVLYFGAYIPLHGLEHVLGAALRLAALQDVRFTLVGDGQEFQRVRAAAARLALPNTRFVRGWLPEDALVEQYVRAADVCLGAFGASPKAARVVPAKVLLALAAGRPVVTRDSPAAREVLRDGETALLCAPASADALALALRRLHDDRALRQRLAAAGPALVAERYAPAPLGRRLRAIVEQAVAAAASR